MNDLLFSMDLVALRNLFFQETREFMAALDHESSIQLEARRERIRLIDTIIQSRKTPVTTKEHFPNTNNQK